MAIYVWFILWMLLMLAMAAGVYALLARLISPTVVQWMLLPGTIVSEVACMVGTLITGGGIRRGAGGGGEGGEAAPAGGKLKALGAVVSPMLSIAAVVAVLLTAWTLLDKPVIKDFVGIGIPKIALAQSGPGSVDAAWDTLWDQAHNQVTLVHRLTKTLASADWRDWRVPLFVVLTLCLAIRIWPARRPIRPTLIAVGFLAGAIAATGAIWPRFASLMEDLWPVLTYVWTTLLLALILTLLATGVVAMVRALSGKTTA
ncbi:MAG: hypothetical protein FWE88_06450 [Phycisphaerae bacterium]|nr:hypothetical protein [Phycisphaerae bacterium]